ncbi:MAG: tRNA pseudouridine(38-40) synthase TruA [Syntrophomonas sp.]|nr:tRNA pseudouridine(38-40) synthase TruA [Syntrophomonas sp.]
MPRIKLIIEYDGSNYHGFQRQNNAHTIQAEIEKQLLNLCCEEISICAAGRTDAGVHARGQVIAFNTVSSIPPAQWTLALNSFLPEDIRVLSSSEASPDFQPQFHSVSKRYAYFLYGRKPAATFYRKYALCNADPLDTIAMSQACQFIEGRHDFRAFCASGSSAKTFERTVLHCSFKEAGALMRLDIEANGFLYNMVRIIMGTLLEVGRKRIAAEGIVDIIESKDRAKAGPTVPPQGLYLLSVTYPPAKQGDGSFASFLGS